MHDLAVVYHSSDMETFSFTKKEEAVVIWSSFNELLRQFEIDDASVRRTAAYMDKGDNGLYFFAQASERDGVVPSIHFELDRGLRALWSHYWQQLMNLSQVTAVMPATRRNEWAEQIKAQSTIEFTPETARSTLENLLYRRKQFFVERVVGIFDNLSGSHVTNCPQGFGQRMIMEVADKAGFVNYRKVEFIHDLRLVLSALRGVPFGTQEAVTNTGDIFTLLQKEAAFGEWHSMDGDAIRIKLFKKGTSHLEIQTDMVLALNRILAEAYPLAIPAEFRTKKPVRKNWDLRQMYLSDKVRFSLSRLRRASPDLLRDDVTAKCLMTLDSELWKTTDQEALTEVVAYLGGVPVRAQGHKNQGQVIPGWFKFDYNAMPAINTVSRLGYLPDQHSHQFFPTPKALAEELVEWAELGNDHAVLEPEAGDGGLVDVIPNKDRLTCVEVSPIHASVLVAKGYATVNKDIFDFKPDQVFDRIIMNPPFSQGRAESHVRHVAQWLAKDGLLGAILPASLKGKEVVPGFVHEWSEVKEKRFVDTDVSVVFLKLSRG